MVERPSQALNLRAGLASVRMKTELVFNDGEAGVRMQTGFKRKITRVPQLPIPAPTPTSYCRFGSVNCPYSSDFPGSARPAPVCMLFLLPKNAG